MEETQSPKSPSKNPPFSGIILVLVISAFALSLFYFGYELSLSRNDTKPKDGIFCGGIAGIECPKGYMCRLDGNYPDAGGTCVFKPVNILNKKPTSRPDQKNCFTDKDCVIAFELNNPNCCSCPFSISRKELNSNRNFVEYEAGKDYSANQPPSCGNVACEPCEPPPTESYCLNNVCSMKAESDKNTPSN